MSSTIAVPSETTLGAYAPEVNTGIAAKTGEREALIAKALIGVASAAKVDIEALQGQVGGGLTDDAPANVTKAAAAVGISTEAARADHKHDITTAAAVSVALANAEGAASSLARSDHTHNSGNQTFALTLDGVGGTATKNTNIVVTANTRAFVTLTTPGAGVSGTRYAVSYVVGGAGVGAVTVTAKDSAAGDNTVNTDNSVLAVTLVEASPIA